MRIPFTNIHIANLSKTKPRTTLSSLGLITQGANRPPLGFGYTGEMINGTFGRTVDYAAPQALDYATLRMRARQLYVENAYAAMVVDRMVDMIIGEGLVLDCDPIQSLTNLKGEEHVAWQIWVDELYALWAESAHPSYDTQKTLGDLEKTALTSALVDGDVLVILRISEETQLPTLQLVSGALISTPNTYQEGTKPKIVQGVEIDERGTHLAYYVKSIENHVPMWTRIPAKGKKTKRTTAFLLYATPQAPNHLRGTPILSRIIVNLAQLGIYTVNELTASRINASLALAIEREKEDSVDLEGIAKFFKPKQDTTSINPSQPSSLKSGEVQTGIIVNHLNAGERITSYDTKRPNINYGTFEEKVLATVAAAMGIPPEILLLKFTSSYSASRAAIIEFDKAMRAHRKHFVRRFARTVYAEWLTSMVALGRVDAPNYLNSLSSQDIYMKKAWENAIFSSTVKANVDPLKEIKAFEAQINGGFRTRASVKRAIDGGDYNRDIETIRVENLLLAKANAPLDQRDSGTPRTRQDAIDPAVVEEEGSNTDTDNDEKRNEENDEKE